MEAMVPLPVASRKMQMVQMGVEAQRIKGIPICVTNQDDCVAWTKCKTGSYSVKSGYQLLCESEAKEVPWGPRMRGLNYSRRTFGVSKCQIRLESFSSEHAQVHYQRRWGCTKERLLIIQHVISA